MPPLALLPKMQYLNLAANKLYGNLNGVVGLVELECVSGIDVVETLNSMALGCHDERRHDMVIGSVVTVCQEPVRVGKRVRRDTARRLLHDDAPAVRIRTFDAPITCTWGLSVIPDR